MKKKQFMSKLAALTMAAAMGLTAVPATAVFAQTVSIEQSDSVTADQVTVLKDGAAVNVNTDKVAAALQTKAANNLTAASDLTAAGWTADALSASGMLGDSITVGTTSYTITLSNAKLTGSTGTVDVAVSDGTSYTISVTGVAPLTTDTAITATVSGKSVTLYDYLDKFFADDTNTFVTYDGNKVNAAVIQKDIDAYLSGKNFKEGSDNAVVKVTSATVSGETVTGQLIVTAGSNHYFYNYTGSVSENTDSAKKAISSALATIAQKEYPNPDTSHTAANLADKIQSDLNKELDGAAKATVDTSKSVEEDGTRKDGTGTFTFSVNGTVGTTKLKYSSSQKLDDVANAFDNVKKDNKGTNSLTDSKNLYIDETAKVAKDPSTGSDIIVGSTTTDTAEAATAVVNIPATSTLSRSIQAKAATTAVKATDVKDAVLKAVEDEARTEGLGDDGVTYKAEVVKGAYAVVASVPTAPIDATSALAPDYALSSVSSTKSDPGHYLIKLTASLPNDYIGWKKNDSSDDKQATDTRTFYVILNTGALDSVASTKVEIADANVIQKHNYREVTVKKGASDAVSTDYSYSYPDVIDLTKYVTITPTNANDTFTYKVTKTDDTAASGISLTYTSVKRDTTHDGYTIYGDDNKAIADFTDKDGKLLVWEAGTYKVTVTDDTDATITDSATLTVSKNFADVNVSNYYSDPIAWGYQNDIVKGLNDTTFGVGTNVTRGQFVSFLYRLAVKQNANNEIKDADEKQVFSDVPTGKYYSKAVQWAAANKIAFGTGDNKFNPDGEVSRAQAISFIYRMKGNPDTGAQGSTTDATAQFTDVHSGDYFVAPVTWGVYTDAVRSGSDTAAHIVSGKSTTTFAPNDPTTREQAVTFIFRAFGNTL